jgi:hypothetical protein
MVSGRGTIIKLSCVVAVWGVLLESVTESVTGYVPAKTVVPLMVTALELRQAGAPGQETPEIDPKVRGNPVMVHLNGARPPDMEGVKL